MYENFTGIKNIYKPLGEFRGYIRPSEDFFQ